MIVINKRWRLESDPYNWILVRIDRKTAKTGKNKGAQISTETKTYHPSICAALRTAMDEDAKLCGDLGSVVAAWDAVQADFARAVSK
jgi:hypothetical protein